MMRLVLKSFCNKTLHVSEMYAADFKKLICIAEMFQAIIPKILNQQVRQKVGCFQMFNIPIGRK